jgi:hypothetical protein
MEVGAERSVQRDFRMRMTPHLGALPATPPQLRIAARAFSTTSRGVA